MSEQLHLWPDDQPGDRLSWSISRDKRLRDCPRKYYLHHYRSRGGRQSSASSEAREIYMLKHLRSRYMWVGEVVHEMIELALSTWRRQDQVPVEAVIERGTRRMRAQYAESIQGIYRERPGQACGLVEHEYREQVPREVWRAQRDRMEQCLRTFFGLTLSASLRELPAWRCLALESFGSFDLDGTTVLVKPDFAWRGADERVMVADWKTGKPRPEEERLQLAVYGLFARRAWGLRGEGLGGAVVYLESGEVREVLLNDADLAAAEQAVRASISYMRELLPEATSGRPDPAGLPKASDRARCAACNFRRICGRETRPGVSAEA